MVPPSVSRPLPSPLDTLVIGKGPAGLAAAAALAERGLRTGVLGPAGPVHWPAQYGAWAEELAAVGYPNMAGHRWQETVVGLGAGKRKILPHAYVRVDKEQLARSLAERCRRERVVWLDGRAIRVEHMTFGSMVRCADGSEIRTRLVIDASGHRPALLDHEPGPLQGYQTAFGLTFEVDGEPLDAERAVLMDWDQSHRSADDAAAPPSFLYAMPLGEGLLFAEETVLVGRPAVPFEELERRLYFRLQALGIQPRRILERERCWIPMGGPLPPPQQTVGFGGAAGMVHPATGYLLTAVLDAAPRFGAAVAEELGTADASPGRAAEAAWEAIWPADRRHRYELFRFGMETLLRLDASQIQALFRAFFDLPDRDWRGYLDNRLSARELAAVMGRVFANAPPAVQGTMVRSALGHDGVRLAATLLRMAVR